MFGGNSVHEVVKYALCDTIPGNIFLNGMNFRMGDDGAYHVDHTCWQLVGGYNEFYDRVFRDFTSMDRRIHSFTTADGTTYTLWFWKGDYFNLGAGGETGIYIGDGWHKQCAYFTNLTMTLKIVDSSGHVLVDYNPEDPMWWITGFNPDDRYQNIDADDLTVFGSIDFSEEPEMWDALLASINSRGFPMEYCIDHDNNTINYMW